MTTYQIDLSLVVEGDTTDEMWDEAMQRLSDLRFVREGATVTKLTDDPPGPTPVPTRWHMFAEHATCPDCGGKWKDSPTANSHGCGADDCFFGEIETDRPGDRFVTAEMARLTDQIRSGAITRADLYDRIEQIQRVCTDAGYGEIHDTEPEYAIEDYVNVLCAEVGWTPVDRWEFR